MTKEQEECPYCHGDRDTVEIYELYSGDKSYRRGQEVLVGFDAFPGDFHVGADIYVSPDGAILLDTGDSVYNDYEDINFCPMCGRKLGENQ